MSRSLTLSACFLPPVAAGLANAAPVPILKSPEPNPTLRFESPAGERVPAQREPEAEIFKSAPQLGTCGNNAARWPSSKTNERCLKAAADIESVASAAGGGARTRSCAR